jgi:hypothetical protein
VDKVFLGAALTFSPQSTSDVDVDTRMGKSKMIANTPSSEPDEIPLEGGGRNVVIRSGDMVLRETGAWAATVHALLRHLEDHGFEGAPRVVGSGFDGKGREMLTYLEGEFVHPGLWSEDAMIAMGLLLRRMHDATASFRPPHNAVWRPWYGRDIGTPDIIGHCDVAPWNTVMRGYVPAAFIDWEAAGPVDRLTEIAMVAWTCAQLYDDEIAKTNNLPDARSRAMLIRRFVDAYGLPAAERHQLTYRIIELAVQSAAAESIEHGVDRESTETPALWGIVWRTRSAAWIVRHRSTIEAALT